MKAEAATLRVFRVPVSKSRVEKRLFFPIGRGDIAYPGGTLPGLGSMGSCLSSPVSRSRNDAAARARAS